MDSDLKTKIKRAAVENFNSKGFYGSSIRDIAGKCGCSLPMLYYYYKSKKELYYEIIKTDYFGLLKRLAYGVKSENIIDFYTAFVMDISRLPAYEKMIYRLGIKVYLTFDGDDELKSVMDEWEKTIYARHYGIISPHLKEGCDGAVQTRALIHILENLIEGIIVKNRETDENYVREELSLILADSLK